ncbi:MAG: M23 family metallopeptidase [Actinomycetota bacterium]|jgi:murein DD-endopeptidase MepM/ murein hydrolase activator NlpD|nr:M23 family metallopeptidase [Actinomycetota bacterium]
MKKLIIKKQLKSNTCNVETRNININNKTSFIKTGFVKFFRFSIFTILFLLTLINQPSFIYPDYKSPFVMPLEGETITGFRQSYPVPDEQKFLKHTGIDIEGNFGQKVIAAGNGIVSYTGFSPIGGRTLVIKHNDKIRTTYLNLMQIYVTTGKYVRQGEVIASIGASDDPSNSAYHLHFGVIYDNKYIDPADLLKIDYSSISRFIYLQYLDDDFNFNPDVYVYNKNN